MRIRDPEFLLPSGATDHLQQISTDISDLHQPNLRVLLSIDMQGKDPDSPLVNRPKQATSLGYIHHTPICLGEICYLPGPHTVQT